MLNNQFGIPTLIKIVKSAATDYCFDRNNFLDASLGAFWGPKQPPQVGDNYAPPGDWPKAGTILSVPRVVRFIWQDADLDGEAILAAGDTGTYTYEIHIASFDLDSIYTGTGVYPAHIHTSYPWPLFSGGALVYATKFTETYTGREAVYIPTEGLTFFYIADGKSVGYQTPAFITPPFSLTDYKKERSLTRTAIAQGWEFASDGFIPAHVLVADDGIPIITTTPDGPFTMGMTQLLKTGRYSIDSEVFDTGEGFVINRDPFTTGVGYSPPPTIDVTIAADNWSATAKSIEDRYKGNTKPYVNSYKHQFGVKTWIEIFSPGGLDHNGNEISVYFATESLHVMVFAKPMAIPDVSDPKVLRIKSAYPNFPQYRVVLFYDAEYMTDSNLPDGVIASFGESLASFCGSMADFGFTFGGAVSYKTSTNMIATIDSLIAETFPSTVPG